MAANRASLLLLLVGCSACTAYNHTLPPWDVEYTDDEVAQQRDAGQKLLNDVQDAMDANATSYSIEAGVYRIDRPIEFLGTTDFVLNASDVEIISENGGNHLNIWENTNFSMQGPMYLDADPFGFTQAVIVDTDNATYIEVETMAQYPDPVDGGIGRVQFFAPNGTMLSTLQVTPTEIEQVKDAIFRLILPEDYWSSYNGTRLQQIQTGNLVSLETVQENITGGIYLRGNNGVWMSQIAVYSKCLYFAQFETGPLHVEQYYGVRRPGTSRLSAGGYPLVSFQGGSWHMLNSELSYNFDDLTDIHSGLYYAYNQTSPTQVYMPQIDGRGLQVGDTLHFYSIETLVDDGSAKVAEIDDNVDLVISQNFRDALNSSDLRSDTANLTLVRLDRAVQLSSLIDIVDIEEYRTKSMIFENCYMHDGLAAGIAGKGSEQYVVRNCSVARVSLSGISSTVDPYWAEGAIAGNILIQDNTVEKCPYGGTITIPSIQTGQTSSAVLAAQANYTTFNNITVNNNTVLDAPGPAISLQYASNINVTGNTIIRPMSAVVNSEDVISQSIDTASAIYLDVIAGHVEVSGNVVIGADSQNVPQIIRASNGTDSSIVSLCSNAVSMGPQQNILQRLPNELWTTVLPNSSEVTTTADFRVESIQTADARVSGDYNVNISDQHTATTFSFSGTGAQFLTCTGPQFGMARIYLDGMLVQDIDASVSLPNVRPSPETGLCNQLLFSVESLRKGQHNLTIENLLQEGQASTDGATDVAISSFAYLKGANQCQPSSNPTSPFVESESHLRRSYINWVNYRTTGILGPNISTVGFAGFAVQVDPQTLVNSTQPLVLSPADISSLAPAPEIAPALPPESQAGPPVPPLFASSG